MRFEDWDIILLPGGPGALTVPPMKEFQVTCHPISEGDQELVRTQGPAKIPLMHCFVGNLGAGTPFRVSLHSWSKPEFSDFTKKSYPDQLALVRFQVRVLVNGTEVFSMPLEKDQWPVTCGSEPGQIILFPEFHDDPIDAEEWNAAETAGRILVIISEVLVRDLPLPVARLKTVAVFSWQYGPLALLQHHGIAWPCAAMWNKPAPVFNPSNGASSSRRKAAPKPLANPDFEIFERPSVPTGQSQHRQPSITHGATAPSVSFLLPQDPLPKQNFGLDWGYQPPSRPRQFRNNSIRPIMTGNTSIGSMPPPLVSHTDRIQTRPGGPTLGKNPMGLLGLPTNPPTATSGENLPSQGQFTFGSTVPQYFAPHFDFSRGGVGAEINPLPG